MQFMIFHLNFYEDDSNQKILRKNLFGLIMSCIYLILIDQFLISITINCAESSDFVLIEKENKCITVKDQIEIVNEMTNKLKLHSQKQKSPSSTNDEPKSKLKDEQVPSTNETDMSSSKSPLFEFNMFTLECNLKSLLEYTIPNIIKDFNESKDLQNKVFDLIKEIKSTVTSYDESLIEKIEEKIKEKQDGNSKFDEIIEGFEKESKKLFLEFEKNQKQFYESKTSQSYALLPDFDDYMRFKFSDVDLKREQLFKGLVLSKLSFFREKNRTTLVFCILNKVLELTPEEFKRDEEVLKAILSFD
jgi:hypothetical protein